MLVLFYVFVAPRNVRGTMNLIAAVFLLVALATALILGFLKIMQFPREVWVSLILIIIGFWAMRDIYYLDREPRVRQKRSARNRPYRYR